jgi:hypothetical protein
MHQRQGPIDAYLEHPIWVALADYSIGPNDPTMNFATRLAIQNRWSRDYAARAIEEYKRFCFLAVTAGHFVAPPNAIDQVWHLHLTYSRDYWERFCPTVLGRALHHDPSEGGADHRDRHSAHYAATLMSYEHTFGRPAPVDFWPREWKPPRSPKPEDSHRAVKRWSLRGEGRRTNKLTDWIDSFTENVCEWIDVWGGDGAGCGGGCGGCGG